jgi:ABC-type transport system substrate-binding protein
VWTFHVRPGFGFSPPSHERVDPGTFAATLERSTSPALTRSEAAQALSDIEGMSAYRRGLTSHISGVQASGNTLTIRLLHPVPDLDVRLAAPWFCAVPKDTPAIPTGLQAPIPSGGPYYVAAFGHGAFMVLLHNPNYPRPQRSRYSAFVYRFDVEERRALDLLRHGRIDYAAFYRDSASPSLASPLGATGDALGIRFRMSIRPEVTSERPGSRIAEFFGPRLGCRSYSPLYAGVDLKRLCPVGPGR